MIRQACYEILHAVEVKERYRPLGAWLGQTVADLKRMGLRRRLYRLPFACRASKFCEVNWRCYGQAPEIRIANLCRVEGSIPSSSGMVETSPA